MKLHYEFSTSTTTSVFKDPRSSIPQTSTVRANISRVVVVAAKPKAEKGISADDLIAELESEFGISEEIAAARQELSASSKTKTISELRLSLGMSQRNLAARAGLHQPNVSAIESGKRKPDYETALRLAGALQVSTDDIYSAYTESQKK